MTDARKWQAARRRIEEERLERKAETQPCPAPIPARDARFNYLVDRRRMLAGEPRPEVR